MFDATHIPTLLQEHDRWVLWTKDGAGQKTPRSVHKPTRNTVATKSSNWGSFAEAVHHAPKHQLGLGFVLGPVQDGPTFSGIDLDKCRDPITGRIERWAQCIIDRCNSYTEISPSGTGVKIFLLGSLPDGSRQGKVYQCEIYDRGRYFTVTGQHLPGTPTTVAHRDDVLRALYAEWASKDLLTLVKLFGFFINEDGDTINIVCPWADHHSGTDKPQDAGLHITADGTIDGFKCFHAGCADKHLGDVRALFGLKKDAGDFVTDSKDRILPNQENIRRALTKLRISFAYDHFASHVMVTHDGRTEKWEDHHLTRARLVVDEEYHFLPTKEFFYDVCTDHARANPVHPVRAYLDGLRWDGTPRLDTWLMRHASAQDTPYVRAVSAIVLMAAVRRVRQPGCKFDEMLVLESGQGEDKSTALCALCADPEWFSDDLPLNVSSKEIIERTAGKWIIEAAELKGIRQAQVEHVKAMLSRRVDGPVRLAFGRISTEIPRQFITIGTTNSRSYLKDSTGNRRFWPVAVARFKVDNLRADRDQLWAEAAARERQGESIRLPETLWEAAAQEQEGRRADHPWEGIITGILAHRGDGPVPVEDVWTALSSALVGAQMHNNRHAEAVNEIMEGLGYRRPKGGKLRINGEPVRCWVKAGRLDFDEP